MQRSLQYSHAMRQDNEDKMMSLKMKPALKMMSRLSMARSARSASSMM